MRRRRRYTPYGGGGLIRSEFAHQFASVNGVLWPALRLLVRYLCAIAVIGIDIGKNSFHVVGHDQRGAIVLRKKWSRGQVEARLANLPPCLIGMEACVGAHHLSRKLQLFGHNARLMPANTCV